MMNSQQKWKSAFKKVVQKSKPSLKIKVDCNGLNAIEINYLEKILEPDFIPEDLHNDEVLFSCLTNNRKFCSAFVLTIVDSMSAEKTAVCFNLILSQVEHGALDLKMAKKCIYLSMERAVELENEEILETLIELVADDDNKVIKNIPALVKACNKNDFKLVDMLVSNGYLLR